MISGYQHFVAEICFFEPVSKIGRFRHQSIRTKVSAMKNYIALREGHLVGLVYEAKTMISLWVSETTTKRK